MKIIMKKILTLLLLATLSFASVSCDEYLDVNGNVDAPDNVKAPLYLSGLQAAWGGLYYDIRALAPLTQMMGTSNYSSFANHYYSKGSDAAGEMWRVTYWLQGMNLENMVNQAVADKCYPLAGIGLAIKAFSWDFTAKYNGDVPCLQAFVPGLLAHDYDYQPVVYEKVREWANQAIEYLAMEDESGYMSEVEEADLIYGGDVEKWTRFAHAVIVRNLSSLVNKSDFASKYAPELLQHAALALQTSADDAYMTTPGGGGEVQFSDYNNFWGVYRGNLDSYWQSDFAAQVMSGTLPLYDEATGERVDAPQIPVLDSLGNPVLNSDGEPETMVDEDFPWVLSPVQYVTDTSDATGHFDPRAAVKIGTEDAIYYDIDNESYIKSWVFDGGALTSWTGPIGESSVNIWGSRRGYASSPTYDGTGRWLYRNDAPYVIMTAAEIQFCVAETQFKLGNKAEALAALQKGVALDLEFTAKWLVPGKAKVEKDEDGNDVYKAYGAGPGGDVISVKTFNKLGNEYLAGPYVGGLSADDLTLSHIMLQKFVALYPWGAGETWVDMRKYHYDIQYTGEYPKLNNGWTKTTLDQKWDSDPTKVYKGLYLAPAQVEYRRSAYNDDNEGSPCYRIRPRYNSEYMWNKNSLGKLQPIDGNADNYHCSIPWFAYPGEYPETL